MYRAGRWQALCPGPSWLTQACCARIHPRTAPTPTPHAHNRGEAGAHTQTHTLTRHPTRSCRPAPSASSSSCRRCRCWLRLAAAKWTRCAVLAASKGFSFLLLFLLFFLLAATTQLQGRVCSGQQQRQEDQGAEYTQGKRHACRHGCRHGCRQPRPLLLQDMGVVCQGSNNLPPCLDTWPPCCRCVCWWRQLTARSGAAPPPWQSASTTARAGQSDGPSCRRPAAAAKRLPAFSWEARPLSAL